MPPGVPRPRPARASVQSASATAAAASSPATPDRSSSRQSDRSSSRQSEVMAEMRAEAIQLRASQQAPNTAASYGPKVQEFDAYCLANAFSNLVLPHTVASFVRDELLPASTVTTPSVVLHEAVAGARSDDEYAAHALFCTVSHRQRAVPRPRPPGLHAANGRAR